MRALRRCGEVFAHSIIPIEILVAGLVVSWALTAIGPLAFAFPLFAIAFMAFCGVRGHRFVATFYFCLLPTSLSAYQALLDYQTGNVHLRYSGLPNTEFFNIAPVYRCENVTYGCVVCGNEWVYQDPYNAAARFLITQFGLATGSYLGPYPTEEDVHSALADAELIVPLAFAQDKVQLSSRTVPLDKAVGLRLMRACGYDLSRDGRVEGGRSKANFIKATSWKNECVVIQIQNEWYEDKPHALIAVIDAQTGRPFAYYPVGEYYHRFPPVCWKERNRE